MYKGSCLCGTVRFEVTGELPAPSACHCAQCRKHSGHYEASTDLPRSAVTIHGRDNVKWYQLLRHRGRPASDRGSLSALQGGSVILAS